MFEKIIIRRSENGTAITLGELAETLLFYQNVHIIIDRGSLAGFLEKIGGEALIDLLSRPNVTATYFHETPATYTTHKPLEVHRFVEIRHGGSKETGALRGKDAIAFVFERHGKYTKRKSKQIAERFLKLAPLKRTSTDYFIKGGLAKAATADLNNSNLLYKSVEIDLNSYFGNKNPICDFIFKAWNTPDGNIIETNIDYSLLNKKAQELGLPERTFSNANFLNNIYNARIDMILAGHYGGELYTSNVSSQLIDFQCQEILKRLKIDESERKEFTKTVVSDGRSIRSAINNEEKSFEDFLKLLDQSERFRKWVGELNPDEKLIKAYFEENSRTGWLDSLPIKTLRYAFCEGLSYFEPISGKALSLADSLFVDKLKIGWRPNRFIDKSLSPFLDY